MPLHSSYESQCGLLSDRWLHMLHGLLQWQLPLTPALRRLFSLSRMVDVLLYNLHRIHNLWPIFLDHLVELLSDGRPSVRAAATDALGRAVGGALAHVTAGCVALVMRMQVATLQWQA